VIPKKAGPNEIGYDLTLINKVKEIDDYTIMYDTGIIIKPPDGYYTEIVPRSSIVKSGWMLANSIGIIDPTYRDTLRVVLKRMDPCQHEIELPSKLCQLILRKVSNDFDVVEVSHLDKTERTGGFGSTDVKKNG
jgi:dUTP pyrophosphatase